MVGHKWQCYFLFMFSHCKDTKKNFKKYRTNIFLSVFVSIKKKTDRHCLFLWFKGFLCRLLIIFYRHNLSFLSFFVVNLQF